MRYLIIVYDIYVGGDVMLRLYYTHDHQQSLLPQWTFFKRDARKFFDRDLVNNIADRITETQRPETDESECLFEIRVEEVDNE